jgi:hypothetical protein
MCSNVPRTAPQDDRHPTEKEKTAAKVSLLVMQDTVRWQGPALALAAQAFLLTIALGKDGTTYTRVVSSLLAALSAASACYLVIRKTVQIDAIKDALNIDDFPVEGVGTGDVKRPRLIPASYVWIATLAIFSLVDLFTAGEAGWHWFGWLPQS